MNKIKIFIVDDHLLVRESLIMMLKVENDIEIVGEAKNGMEALEKIRNVEVDIVLQDVLMPQMDGFEITKLIKNINEKIEIILLSINIDANYIVKGKDCGATTYLSKDSSKGIILETIRAVFYKTMKNLRI